MMPAGMIVAEGLTKQFHTVVRGPGWRGALRALTAPQRVPKTVVDGVSLRVAPGELLALLGPNGAGKSTTIKMLSGILTPTSGRVEVNGIVPHQDRIANARGVGAVFGQRSQLWRDLPARESLSILRDIYGVPDADYRARLAEFNRILELPEFWDDRARQLSLGQRVRCDLAAALIHDPPVVFLDEPTIGMDVVVKEQVREFLRDQVDRRGRTVLLTTHDMAEVARLAGRVALIDHGRLMYDGAIGRLRDLVGASWQVHVTLDTPAGGPEVPGRLDVPGMRVVRSDGVEVTFAAGDAGAPMAPRDAVRRLIEYLPVIDIRVEEPDLEDVVRAAFGGAGGMERYSKPASEHGPVEPVRAAGAGDSDHSGSFE
jgi:ABC-2 type transport system ATP-binding protein